MRSINYLVPMKPLKAFSVLAIIFFCNASFKLLPGKDAYRIVISKSEYTLSVYDNENNWVATYPVVFGNDDQGDKLYEGDRRTPEGVFHIVAKKPHAKWSKYLALDYPTKESYEKFNERKMRGEIPYNAKIGGGIGIHGTWPRDDYAVDNQQNWTLGCVSTKNDYIKEIYDLLPIGTTVEIRP